jgi:hypothetical protein
MAAVENGQTVCIETLRWTKTQQLKLVFFRRHAFAASFLFLHKRQFIYEPLAAEPEFNNISC